MKKKRTIIVLIMGIIFGLIISGLGTYAATTYAISSNKVSYTDNSKLGVDNVQAAIDGTCSNIDTRLTNIETNLSNVGSDYKSGNFSVANCASGQQYLMQTLEVEPDSVYILFVMLRVLSGGTPSEIGLRVLGKSEYISEHAGSSLNDIYPTTTMTVILYNDSTVSIYGVQRGISTASIDGRYRLIKLK
ncbi:MAG: hypothetical protein J6A17_05070 [Bacilli bacterium]|nr:hypothetical protein [Bacilli bacterium]